MRASRIVAVAATVAATLVLAACGSGDDTGETGSTDEPAGDSTFPVTITHVFGETTIEAKPERIASVAWANHEVPLALGVVPVGMSKATWGDDDGDGVLPWVEEKLTELGAETPVLFDETDGIDFEAVADTAPDVILAAYSGLTREEYDTLSKIAPVVAYPDVAWATTLEELITINSEAIGLGEEGKAFYADLQKQVADASAEFPQLAGKTAAFSWIDPADLSKVGFYTTADPRAGFLDEVGIGTPAVVTEASAGTDEFYAEVSAEEAQKFDDVDILITYGDDTTLATMQADPLVGRIPAISNGAVALLQDSTPLAASANPSPLSIGWGIDDYLALLAGAADKVK